MAKYDFTNATPFNEQPLYKQGYEDAIDKACGWLKENAFSWIDDNKVNEDTRKMKQQKIKELQDEFRKAMEEEK